MPNSMLEKERITTAGTMMSIRTSVSRSVNSLDLVMILRAKMPTAVMISSSRAIFATVM